MARLIYSAITSLDGYVEDSEGQFEWAAPDDEVLGFINDLELPIGTYLYGRRMYETMVYWESVPGDRSVPAPVRDFTRIWQAAEKVVYSRSLTSALSSKTRIEPSFDAEAIRRLKASSQRDLSVGGADLAGQAIGAGLVDELQVFIVPVVMGGGKPWLPRSLRLNLELLESRRFGGGVIFLRYCPEPFDPEARQL